MRLQGIRETVSSGRPADIEFSRVLQPFPFTALSWVVSVELFECFCLRCGSQLDRGQRTHLWDDNSMSRMLWIRLLNAMSRAEQSKEQSPVVNLFDMQTTTKIAIMSHLHIKAKAVGACENTYLNTYVNTYTHAYIHSSIQYKESLDDIAKCNVSLQN